MGDDEGGYLWQTIHMAAGRTYDLAGGLLVMRNLSTRGRNVNAGRVRLFVDSDLLWDWNVGGINASTSVTNAFALAYAPGTTGDHIYKLLFTRTYRNWATPPAIYHYADDLSVTRRESTPELSTWALLACGGLVGLVLRRRRKA
jgi:MYXO-CTERM domain-containing protein